MMCVVWVNFTLIICICIHSMLLPSDLHGLFIIWAEEFIVFVTLDCFSSVLAQIKDCNETDHIFKIVHNLRIILEYKPVLSFSSVLQPVS